MLALIFITCVIGWVLLVGWAWNRVTRHDEG